MPSAWKGYPVEITCVLNYIIITIGQVIEAQVITYLPSPAHTLHNLLHYIVG